MGWLFAVALGLQERRRAKVFAALGPIALGHLVSIAAVVALIGWARFAAASPLLRPAGAAINTVRALPLPSSARTSAGKSILNHCRKYYPRDSPWSLARRRHGPHTSFQPRAERR